MAQGQGVSHPSERLFDLEPWPLFGCCQIFKVQHELALKAAALISKLPNSQAAEYYIRRFRALPGGRRGKFTTSHRYLDLQWKGSENRTGDPDWSILGGKSLSISIGPSTMQKACGAKCG